MTPMDKLLGRLRFFVDGLRVVPRHHDKLGFETFCTFGLIVRERSARFARAHELEVGRDGFAQ